MWTIPVYSTTFMMFQHGSVMLVCVMYGDKEKVIVKFSKKLK